MKTLHAKTIYGSIAGIVMYAIIGLTGLFLFKVFWTAYATASLDKSYTWQMKVCRLTLGLMASFFAGYAATRVANDNGKAALFAGWIILMIVGYTHFFVVWNDYPVWYHLAYLVPIVPVIGWRYFWNRKEK